jgi:transcriptional regulator with XRE-family HTH domain
MYDCEYSKKHIAKKLMELRTIRNLSQSKVADILGVSVLRYGKYETAELSISAAKLFIISRFLEIDINFFYLYDGDDISEPLLQDDEIEILNFYQSVRNYASKGEILSILKKIFSNTDSLTH